MSRSYLALGILSVLGVVGAACDIPGHGIDLVYMVLFPSDVKVGRRAETEQVRDVLLRRIRKMGWDGTAKVKNDNEIYLKIHGAARTDLPALKRVLGRIGKLEFYACAKRGIQEKYNRDKHVPAGYKVMTNTPKGTRQTEGEYEVWNVDQILLHKPAIIEGSMITDAKPDQQITQFGISWVTSFQLDQEGSKRFDNAAKELYRDYSPCGMIAIVLDEQIASTPVVQAEEFGGTSQITGAASEMEAMELAVILQSGKLPYPIGREGKKGPEPGIPVLERVFGYEK